MHFNFFFTNASLFSSYLSKKRKDNGYEKISVTDTLKTFYLKKSGEFYRTESIVFMLTVYIYYSHSQYFWIKLK